MTTTDDLRAMISASPGATTATFGSYSTPVILDFEGSAWGPDGQAQVSVEAITLTYCYLDLPGLEPGSSIVAGDQVFTVARGPRRRGDGLEAVVILEEA